jgi:hypothetical protein
MTAFTLSSPTQSKILLVSDNNSGFSDPHANSYDKQCIQFLQDSVMAINWEGKTLTLVDSRK